MFTNLAILGASHCRYNTYCGWWIISSSNYSYLRTINHSYWSYVHQLSYRKRGPHFVVNHPPCFLLFLYLQFQQLTSEIDNDELEAGEAWAIWRWNFHGIDIGDLRGSGDLVSIQWELMKLWPWLSVISNKSPHENRMYFIP